MVVCIVFGLYVVCATFADLTMAFVFLKDSVIYASVVESIADFLELALQFGMIMMFACAFPLIFCFAALVCGYDDSLQSCTHA